MMELQVRAVAARNLIDKQTFGKQDPYCKLTIRKRTFKTRVHNNGDRAPAWNEKFTFEVANPDADFLEVKIKDKNFTSSTLIGECKIPISTLKHGNIVDEWFSLYNNSRSAGEINLRMQLAPLQGRAPAAAYPAAVAAAYPAPAGYPAPQQYQQYPPQQYPPQQYPPQQYPPQPDYAQQQQQQQQQWQLQQQQAQISQQQQQIAQQQQQIHANQYAPPPPPAYVVGPPPVVVAPAPVVYGAPPPVVYGAPGYYVGGPPHHHHHHDDGGYYGGDDGGYRRGGGGGGGMGGAGSMALGVGAGVLGGMILGEALDDIF